MLDKNKKLINEDGFYAGSELMWGMDDVRNVLERFGRATIVTHSVLSLASTTTSSTTAQVTS